MWRSGFWGTPREEQWRRRKEKELEREYQIRGEEQQVQMNLQQRHQEELQSKDNVLDLTRRMLTMSRDNNDESQRKRRAADAGDVPGGEDSNGNNGNSETDQKPSGASSNKKPRVSVKQEADDDHLKPDTAVSSRARIINVEQDVTENNARESQPTKNIRASDDKELELIRENLLGLSFAMFDTLFSTTSFQSKPFCDFLIRSGEKGLAEQIALAGVEKSHGSEADVRYVLYDLVPQSALPDELVQRVTDLLSEETSSVGAKGKKVLIEWQKEHGNTDAAFQATLKISDELERFQQAYPLLEGNAERRQQLKMACRYGLCDNRVIGVFGDEDWPDFVAFVVAKRVAKGNGTTGIRTSGFGNPCPDRMTSLTYAAEKMDRDKGRAVATKIMVRDMRRSFEGDLHNSVDVPGPSRARTLDAAREQIRNTRQESTKFMSKCLTQIRDKVCTQDVKVALGALGIDWMGMLVKVVTSPGVLKLPPSPNQCLTNHRDILAVFKCKKCRDAMLGAALGLGQILALRRHDLTKNDGRFRAIGCGGGDVSSSGCNNSKPVEILLRDCRIHDEAIQALLGDSNPEEFMSQRG